jgi:periplasmic mercuric ion binding protein
MNKLMTSVAFALCLLASSAAFAAEQTVTLAVQNMYCAACPHTVKASLEAVPGVAKVALSYQDKTAKVDCIGRCYPCGQRDHLVGHRASMGKILIA